MIALFRLRLIHTKLFLEGLTCLSRIFSVLALISLTLIAVNLVIGFSIANWPEMAKEIRTAHQEIDKLNRDGLSEKDQQLQTARTKATDLIVASRPIRARVLFHMLLGIGAGIGAVLVNSISVTYFVGTSRWCKEVVDTYGLDRRHIQQSNALKRQTFPWAVAGMLAAVVMVALGGAADPGNSLADPAAWAMWHRLGAMLGLTFIGFSFWNQFNNILANFVLINVLMAEVHRIRQERGLET